MTPNSTSDSLRCLKNDLVTIDESLGRLQHLRQNLANAAERSQVLANLKQSRKCADHHIWKGSVSSQIAPFTNGLAQDLFWTSTLLELLNKADSTGCWLAAPSLDQAKLPPGCSPPESLQSKLMEECELIGRVMFAMDASQAASHIATPDGQIDNNAIWPITEPGVVLQGPGESPIVCGKKKKPLTRAGYDVVRALLEAGDRGLSKDELDRKSKHGDARKILKRLAESDPDWKAAISLPGRTGRAYRIGSVQRPRL